MNSIDLQMLRVAVITCLAEKSPSGHIGRTALMKYCYFLQTLRHVPLGYRFTLYSYGPFDSDVLADLDSAEALGAVKSSLVYYSGGYGYEIRPAEQSQRVIMRAAGYMQRYEADTDWVITEFGNLGSAELELASTIVYVDREAATAPENLTFEELLRRVRDLKPHFTGAQVQRHVESLLGKALLKSLGRTSNSNARVPSGISDA